MLDKEDSKQTNKQTKDSIYNIYNIIYRLKQTNNTSEIQNLLHKLLTLRGASQAIYCPFQLWQLFIDTVKLSDPFSSASEKLRQFMTAYIEQYVLQQTKPQLQITQFFINKPKQVNIAEKQVVVKQIDYSDLPLEELQKRYDLAKKQGESVEVQFLSFELKKRQSKAFLEKRNV